MSRERREQRTTNVFDANIETLATSERFHPVAYVFARIVNDFIGAVLADDRGLGRTPDGRDDPSSKQMRELDASEANAA